jgi:hypothetical protein
MMANVMSYGTSRSATLQWYIARSGSIGHGRCTVDAVGHPGRPLLRRPGGALVA